jgi:hypothetical protein
MIPASVNEELRKYRSRYYVGHVLALVDGVKYEQHAGRQLAPEERVMVSLFAGTEDSALAHAGPWLINPATARDWLADLDELEQATPGVIWLITAEPVEQIAEKLRPHLNIKDSRGRSAMLRFWDPRVFHALNAVCQEKSGRELFGIAEAWQYLHEGQRFTINDNGTF